MKEAPQVRQIRGDPPRRWFYDDYFDLIIWYATDGTIMGFQLCYDRYGYPRAFTWTHEGGYAHHAIDDGDDPHGHHKSTPILIADGVFDSREILRRFSLVALTLPSEIRSLVTHAIQDYTT